MPPAATASQATAGANAGPDPTQDLAIVGLARDCALTLEQDVQRLSAAMPPCRRLHWHVVESDSSDGTVEVLERLRNSVPAFGYRSLGRLSAQLPLRTQRIAHCRNVCSDWVREVASTAPVGHVVVADLDGLNARINAAALRSCWAREGWSACTANQAGLYYDIWALRHPVWCAGDCWQEWEFLARHGGNPDRARLAAVYARMIPIAEDADWIEVDSAFGGLAVYRTEALLAGRYEGVTDSGAEVCEHVSLHAAIRAAGGRIFINPRLVNADGADLAAYWPESRQIARASNSLLFRGLLRLFFGKQASREIRRLIRSVV